jgi:hypothetical protein
MIRSILAGIITAPISLITMLVFLVSMPFAFGSMGRYLRIRAM